MSRTSYIECAKKAIPYVKRRPGIEIEQLMVCVGVPLRSENERKLNEVKRRFAKELERVGYNLKEVSYAQNKSDLSIYVHPLSAEAEERLLNPLQMLVDREVRPKKVCISKPGDEREQRVIQAIADEKKRAIANGQPMPKKTEMAVIAGVAKNYLSPSHEREAALMAYEEACKEVAQANFKYEYNSVLRLIKHQSPLEAIATLNEYLVVEKTRYEESASIKAELERHLQRLTEAIRDESAKATDLDANIRRMGAIRNQLLIQLETLRSA